MSATIDSGVKAFERPIVGTTCVDLKTTAQHGPWLPNAHGRGERCAACGLLRYVSPVEGEPPAFESFAPLPSTPPAPEPSSGVRLRQTDL